MLGRHLRMPVMLADFIYHMMACGYLCVCLSFPLSRQHAPLEQGQSLTHFGVPSSSTVFCTQQVIATAIELN